MGPRPSAVCATGAVAPRAAGHRHHHAGHREHLGALRRGRGRPEEDQGGGAPFVGAAAATLAIAEIIRLLHGGPVHELIDLDLKSPEYRSAVPTRTDFSAFNPGYVLSRRPDGAPARPQPAP